MPLDITTDVTNALEPVTLAEAKLFLKYDGTEDVPLIQRCITAARQIVTNATGVTLGTTTYTLTLDSFPLVISLHTSPVQSITSIVYTDNNGDSQTLSTDVYDLDTVQKPNKIRLKWDQNWPTTRTIHNAVVVTFVAGYTAPSLVPATLKQEVLFWVSHLFENRDVLGDNMAKKFEVPNTGKWMGWMNRQKEFV